MREASVIVASDGVTPLYWCAPVDRTSVRVPDTHSMWERIWEHRHAMAGTAHTHPGGGYPHPSQEDVTTWAATEDALGRKFTWWIVSSDEVTFWVWAGPGRLDYAGSVLVKYPLWVDELRRLSEMIPVSVDEATWSAARAAERPEDTHPCDCFDPARCVCEGACSCHWKVLM